VRRKPTLQNSYWRSCACQLPAKSAFDQVRASASPVRVNLPKSPAVSTGRVIGKFSGRGYLRGGEVAANPVSRTSGLCRVKRNETAVNSASALHLLRHKLAACQLPSFPTAAPPDQPPTPAAAASQALVSSPTAPSLPQVTSALVAHRYLEAATLPDLGPTSR
jgi:hypothetical protein